DGKLVVRLTADIAGRGQQPAGDRAKGDARAARRGGAEHIDMLVSGTQPQLALGAEEEVALTQLSLDAELRPVELVARVELVADGQSNRRHHQVAVEVSEAAYHIGDLGDAKLFGEVKVAQAAQHLDGKPAVVEDIDQAIGLEAPELAGGGGTDRAGGSAGKGHEQALLGVGLGVN